LTAPAPKLTGSDSNTDLAVTDGKTAFLNQKPKPQDVGVKKSSFLTAGAAGGE